MDGLHFDPSPARRYCQVKSDIESNCRGDGGENSRNLSRFGAGREILEVRVFSFNKLLG